MDDLLRFGNKEDNPNELEFSEQKEVDKDVQIEEVEGLGEVLRDRIDGMLPDPDLLISYALFTSGRKAHLSDSELKVLQEALPKLQRLEKTDPFFADIVRDTVAQATEFESYWETEVNSSEPRSRRLRLAVEPTRDRWFGMPAVRYGAFSAVAVAVAVVSLLTFVGSSSEEVRITAADSIAEEVLLEDGSTVRLMPGSSLAYDVGKLDGFDRRVSLEGDAYFVVASAAGRPFVVSTDELTATVIGTRFGISQEESVSEIVLASGEVHISSNAHPEDLVVLQPGTMTRVETGQEASAPVPVDVVDALGWTGLFVFRGETYRRIAEHLTRHYQVSIDVDPLITQERQTGTFEKSLDLEEILETLELSGGVIVSGNTQIGYILSPAP